MVAVVVMVVVGREEAIGGWKGWKGLRVGWGFKWWVLLLSLLVGLHCKRHDGD